MRGKVNEGHHILDLIVHSFSKQMFKMHDCYLIDVVIVRTVRFYINYALRDNLNISMDNLITIFKYYIPRFNSNK